jgi:hypothetical protein
VKQPTHSDQTIIRYLLNELSEEDGVSFEDAYLENEGLFERVRAVEEELIEDYVKGDLSGRQRRFFERHYLATGQRRARVETARKLVHVCSLESPAKTAKGRRDGSRFSFVSWRLRLSERQYQALGFGVAAALVLIVGLASVNELRRLQGRLAAVSEERAGLERRALEAEQRMARERKQLAEERQQGIALRAELGDVSRRLDRLEEERARSQRKNQVVLLALSPGVREVNKPDRAVISAETELVELRAMLEKQETTRQRSYRAAVKTVDGGREIWSREGIKPRQTRSAQYVDVRVPAEHFRAAQGRDFMLILSAPAEGGGGYEELENCYFQVISR